MKVIIAYGAHEADYLIKTYARNHNEIVVVNPDQATAEYLSTNNGITAIVGNPTKEYDLHLAQIEEANLFIALSSQDVDNFVACTMAKRLYRVRKCVATVTNPKNVDLFKTMGVDIAISSTYLLAQSIQKEADISQEIKTQLIGETSVIITELELKTDNWMIGKRLVDLSFPPNANISCIFRYPQVIIPNGMTVFEPKDRMLVLSTPEDQNEIIRFIDHK